MNLSERLNETCGYTEQVTLSRFLYISFFGCIAAAGLLSNIVLLYIFATKRRNNNSPPNLYPAVLSFLDAMLCLLFLLMFVVDVQMLYWESYELFEIYHRYIVAVFAIAKLVQFLIPHLLILATAERYTWIAKVQQRFIFFRPRGRILALSGVVVYAVVMRGHAMSAYKVEQFDLCPEPLRTLAVDAEPWAKEDIFATFDQILVSLSQTVFPFLVLSLLNTLIVIKLHAYDKNKQKSVDIDEIPVLEKTDRKRGVLLKHRSLKLLHSLSLNRLPSDVRKSVFTMVAIVSTYMVCNVPHMILSLLELTNSPMLKAEEDHFVASEFYTILGDTVSILYMLSSAIRILIYMTINRAIRNQVFLMFGIRRSATTAINRATGV